MSAKNCDKHNRFRSITIGFRVSPEENEMINELVALSGMDKQAYIVERLQNESMSLTMNSRIYLRIVMMLDRIYDGVIQNNVTEIDAHLLSVISDIIKKCNVED